MAKKVIKFEDATGKLHDTLAEAQAGDRESLLKEQLYDIAQTINTYNMSADDLAAALFEYRNSLRGILVCGMNVAELPQPDLESEFCVLKTELRRRGAV